MVGIVLLACSAAAIQPSFTRRELARRIGCASAAPLLPALPTLAATGAQASVPAAKQPGLKLNTGVMFPTASFGLQVYDDDTAEKLTLVALEAGSRNFFASVLARNQRGFARAIKKSGIPREELFICGSVLSNQAQGFDAAKGLSARGCRQNLEAFAAATDYVDMIMLDYPGPDAESIRGQWAALEEMAAAKTTRSLAVSNFSPQQLDVLLADAKATVPTVNQLPYGVGFASYYGGRAAEVVAENTKRGVVVQAWSPLQKALRGSRQTACAEIGVKYGKTAAQVALRWIADTGCTFTTAATRSANGAASGRFAENFDIFDFELTKEEVETLAKL